MKLKNIMVVGTLVQYYELSMLPEMVHSYVKMLEEIENPEIIHFHYTFSLQEQYEEINWEYFDKKYGIAAGYRDEFKISKLKDIFEKIVGCKGIYPANLTFNFKTNNDPFYNIADFRRDLCWNWCDKVDIVVFGESDTMFGSKSLVLIDSLHEMVKDSTPKYVANFAGRKNWDSSWDCITHPMFKKVKFEDNDEWTLNNEASEKAYMTYDRLEEINNINYNDIEIIQMNQPKADGAGLILSSELLKSGVTLPKGILLQGEDEAILRVAKQIMGDKFVQYHFSNYLRLHNRRHPYKRTGILNENNLNGFADKRKGDWWIDLEQKSKENLNNLFTQNKFNTL